MRRRNPASTKREDIPAALPQLDWVVVGNASRFLIYESEKGRRLTLTKSFQNNAAHLKISDLEGDQPGRSFSSASKSHGGHQTGALRHSYSSEQDPKAHALERFVSEVRSYIENGRNHHSFARLILIAEERLLGQLRASLDKHTQPFIFHTFPKDLAWLSGAALEDRIKALLTESG